MKHKQISNKTIFVTALTIAILLTGTVLESQRQLYKQQAISSFQVLINNNTADNAEKLQLFKDAIIQSQTKPVFIKFNLNTGQAQEPLFCDFLWALLSGDLSAIQYLAEMLGMDTDDPNLINYDLIYRLFAANGCAL